MVKSVKPHVRAYLRISIATDESQSIDQQRRKIGQWAALHHEGLPVERYEDEGVSGSRQVRRPGRDRLLEDLGPGDVLAALKVDRLARSTRDLLNIVDLAHERGATVAFVEQQIDTSGAYGAFTLTLLAALAELEAKIISERVSAAQETFRRDGRHGSGKLPYGFRSVRDDRGWLVVRPDPETGPRLRRALLAVIDGASVTSQARELGMQQNTFRRICINPRLYGRTPGGRVDPDGALLSATEWRALEARMQGPKAWSRTPGYGPVLLCHYCTQRLYLNTSTTPHYGGAYKCAGSHEQMVSVRRDQTDEYVEREFLARVGDVPMYVMEHDVVDGDRVERLAALDIELDEAYDVLRGARGAERASLLARIDDRQLERDRVESEQPAVTTRLVDTGQTKTEFFRSLPEDEKGGYVAALIRVVVHPANRPEGRYEVREDRLMRGAGLWRVAD